MSASERANDGRSSHRSRTLHVPRHKPAIASLILDDGRDILVVVLRWSFDPEAGNLQLIGREGYKYHNLFDR